MPLSFEVLHALPGRVRLRIPDIKDNPALGDDVAQRLVARPGVTDVRVNATCASVVISYDTAELTTFVPEKHLKGFSFSEEAGRVTVKPGTNGNGHKNGRLSGFIKRIASLILPTVTLGLTLTKGILPIAPAYALVAAAAAPIFCRAARTIVRDRRLGVDFLDATAIAIMGAQRNLPTCAFMAWLISVGEHIREETSRRSQKAIADLLDFHSDTAVVLQGRKRIRVPVDYLRPGNLVVVNAGDSIPVDGVIVRGRSGIDQRSLSGESALLERQPGEMVYAGSIAVDGEIVVEAIAVGINTRAGKIVQILRSAPAQETKIEDYAARFADRLVLPTFAMSGAVYAMSRNLARALSMLIIDFGTGVRVAAPTAFLSFMAYAAQKNIVVKGGRAMEKLANVDTIVFDKTGTLTTGLPEIRDIIPMNGHYNAQDILRLAAAAEAGLNHPVAHALAAKAAEEDGPLPEKGEARLRVGLGIKAEIEGKNVLVGSCQLMAEESVDTTMVHWLQSECEADATSPLYVAVNDRLVGIITYSDKIRPESAEVVESLRGLGIRKIIMVTGDREHVARVTARKLGIEEYVSEVFPEKKLDILKSLQKKGHTVAVIGDGINDSLALARADVAIAPAQAADAAKEAADVLLMEDDLRLLVEAISIAKSAVGLVKQNFTIVAVPNAGAIALAATGLLGPPGATFINNGSTVAAAVNGLRPLLKNGRNGKKHGGLSQFAVTDETGNNGH